ncbi:hypothetical protein JHU04_003838 [Brenneria sp. 4F2]|nr:hypothetical protein [Brenneria bubanii]
MPLPERMKQAKVSRQKIKALAEKAEDILATIDGGAGEEDEKLIKMMAEWNSQVVNAYEFSDFRDYSSWTSAQEFTMMAFNQESYFEDLTWDELVQIFNFICAAEGSESEQHHALSLLEKNFDINPSNLIYWPDAWFEDEDMFHVELTAEEMAGYLMARSGRYLADAPEIELKYPMPATAAE